MVQNLYSEVVARHPLGVPSEADMKIFGPYLSKALLRRIDLAIACGDDWYRQHPDPNLKPEIGWLEFGLFTGGNEKALPRTFRVERTRAEKDGSFRVQVRLTWGPPSKPWVWRVVAIVLREDDRLVVDEVVFLKDKETLEGEFRLSDVLATGCDGPHWTGQHER